MNPTDFLRALSALDVSLTVTQGKLQVDAPQGVMTKELRAQLGEQKEALMALLTQSPEDLQSRCLLCDRDVEWYDEEGRASCTLHRYHASKIQCAASPSLVRVTQSPFFLDDVAELTEEVRAMREPVVLDLETTGLHPLQDRIVSLAVGCTGRVSLIDLRPYYDLPPERQARWQEALRVLLSLPVTWVGHNIKFDWLFLSAQLGIRLERVYDTMLVEQVLHGVGLHDKGLSVGLRETAARYGLTVSKEQRSWFPGLDTRPQEWHAPFPQEQLIYIVQDIEVPARIYQAQQSRLTALELVRVADLEHQALPALASMQSQGVLIDQHRWRAILHQKEERRQQQGRALAETLGKALHRARTGHQQAREAEARRLMLDYQNTRPACSWQTFHKQGLAAWDADHPFPQLPKQGHINLASSAQVLIALRTLGLPLTSVQEEALEPYAATQPVVAQLLQWKKLHKFSSAFGENLLAHVDTDGRLRGDFVQIGAVSGRIICRNPNLQQIPSHEKREEENIRTCFIAPPGMCLLKADLSNIELRILAEVSRDPVMLRLFAEGKDLHAETAKLMFGLPEETDTKRRQYKEGVSMRDVAKTINFGLAYGMGPQGLANRIGVSVETAKALMRTYFTTYAGVARWLRTTAGQALKQGYAVTLSGRRRPFVLANGVESGLRGVMERAAKNHPIQGTNADILKRALVVLYEALPESVHIILSVHDEIVLECPDALVEEATQVLKTAMVQACRDFLKIVHIPEPEVLASSYWKKD